MSACKGEFSMIRSNFTSFFRREPVLCLAAACALASMFLVPPSAAYLGYVDLRVLCLLFCLMAVVAGFQACGVFPVLAQRLLSGRRSFQVLVLALVWLPFFTSMLVTNDVALLTFVPFTLLILDLAGASGRAAWVVVLQTVAANLGSMATPVGNPQNLFLYAAFHLTPARFFSAILPYAGASLLALTAAALCTRGGAVEVRFPQPARIQSPRLLGLLCVLFVLCLLSVFRVLPYGALTAVVALSLLIARRTLLAKVDYSLLLTFVCFFVFAGNLGQLSALRDALAGLMERSALLTSALASQIISNVPAAVLLAGFTDDWRGLLLGTDLGGLGTPIASLASLISLRLYLRSPGARAGHYLLLFSLVNFGGLAVLLLAAALLS